jgi:hypothetical protein
MTLLNKVMFVLMGLFSLSATAQQFETQDWGRIDTYRERVTIECSSDGYRYETCHVGEGIIDVRLVRQISNSACNEGRSWGYTYDSIWVDQGCRATFEVVLRGSHGGGGGGGGHHGNYSDVVSCSSNGYRYETCSIGGGRVIDVRLESQVSRTACVEGSTWGWNNGRIWVDRGCRGTFRVYYR